MQVPDTFVGQYDGPTQCGVCASIMVTTQHATTKVGDSKRMLRAILNNTHTGVSGSFRMLTFVAIQSTFNSRIMNTTNNRNSSHKGCAGKVQSAN